MATISKPAASLCFSILLLMGGTLAAQTTDAAPAPAQGSKVRIVRLSDVRGDVQMDRNTGSFESVLANLPVVEHNRLQTGLGVAEIEFEDNSTLRVGPRSIVEFPELDRSPAGATISSVRLVKGMAYVSLLKTRGNEFNLLFGKRKLQLPPASHVRLQLDGQQATLAVLDGTVHIDGSGGPVDVSKKKTVTFPTLEQDAEPTIAKNFVPVALDSWDKNQAETHAQAKANTAFGAPYSYGLADMMYYGAFTSVGSCGSMWRPYFASANWSPYSNGAWAWYQGAGYTWVSPYPWGWTPYHFGNWSYCSGAGWGWRPGGSWNGLNNVAGGTMAGGGAVPTGPVPHPLPARPIRPPSPGGPTLRAVDMQPLVRSEVTAGSFVFRRDSAGLGIPRDGLGRLDKISHSAIDHGTATTPVYVSGPPAVMRNGRPVSEGVGVTSVHRGSAMENTGQSPSGRGPWNGGDGNSRSGAENGNQPARSFDRPSNQPERSMPQPINQPSMQQPQPSQQGGRTSPNSPAPVQGRPN